MLQMDTLKRCPLMYIRFLIRQYRLDVFFAGARLTDEEYLELTNLLASK